MIGYLINYAVLPVTIGGITGSERREMINKTCRGKQTRNGICISEVDVKALCHFYVMSVSYVGIQSALYRAG
jgi:hypothetical protein